MLPRTAAIWGAAAALVFGAVMVVAYDGGAPTAHTGAPAVASVQAERLCNRCHGGNTLNTGGSVQLLDAPTVYKPDSTYTLRLRITSSQTTTNSGRLWGFEITAVLASDGSGAGTFASVAGQGTAIAAGSGAFAGRSYALVGSGNRSGGASPSEWQIKWTAPATATGPVTFYYSGMAADGGGGTGGDWVYTGSLTLQDITTPVRTRTWGQLKARYL